MARMIEGWKTPVCSLRNTFAEDPFFNYRLLALSLRWGLARKKSSHGRSKMS
jgi:hypothetical protein